MANFFKFLWSKLQKSPVFVLPSKDKKVKASAVVGIESDEAEKNPTKIVGSTKLLTDSIVAVISNMESKGPLSVCINGKWGSGKSTLIFHAIRKLREENCTCVFFNAWHHEREHHLYVALIEQIRKSWIPRQKLSYPYIELVEQKGPLEIRKEWVRIYCHIWCRRFRKSCVQSFLFLLVTLASFVGFWYLLLFGIITFIEINRNFSLSLADFSEVGIDSRMYFTFLLISFVSWIYFWYSPYNILKAFAALPVSQVSARVPWLMFAQFAEQLSFRYRFSISFNEVCEALNSIDRKLVVVIDDIDRCNRDQILQLIEAVNFLCTSGPCFVLLAMDKDRVIKMLGKNNDEKYFRKFLEKIINLTVNVQPVTAEEIQFKPNKYV